jgi:hypothetical protein
MSLKTGIPEALRILAQGPVMGPFDTGTASIRLRPTTFSPNQVIGQDPNGKDQHEPGSKLDAGKPRPALVLGDFSRALSAVTDVGTYGAAKYTDHGWLTVPDGVQRYSDAMMRHWLDESAGIACDRETNLLHAAHLAWNALARLELMLLQREPKE